MNNFSDIVCRGREGPALMFRSQVYDFECPDEFLADVMALANADIVGQRAIILGVDPGNPGERRVCGIPYDTLPDTARLQQLVDEHIEPDISVKIVPGDALKKTAVIVIGNCAAPPYLLKKPCGAHLLGASFIRRHTENVPLSRKDHARLRAGLDLPAADEAPLAVPQVLALTFEDGTAERSLSAMAEAELPSSIAARKLESAIKSRAEVDSMGGADTGIVRLMHVRAFGLDEPFSKKSVDELRDELRAVRRTFELEDKFHRFEKTSHRLNFVLTNAGDEILQGARITFRMQREHGFELSPAMFALGVNTTTRKRELTEVKKTGYPSITISGEFYEFAAQVGPVRGQSRGLVLQEPLRLAVSEAAAGKSVAIFYELKCKGSGDIVNGSLTLRSGPVAAG